MLLDLVDVFGARPLAGNPLAVVHGAEHLTDAAMLRLTQWLGYSETTFLLSPGNPQADYRVRIFYPAGELPFAGHPTLGSCHAWLAAGGEPRQAGGIVQECGVGLIEVRQQDERLAFRAPPFTRHGPLTEAEREAALRLAGVPETALVEAVHVANGPGWQLLRLRSVDDVLAARPAPQAPAGTDIGLAAPYPPGSGLDWEVRGFFTKPGGALAEDPVTGSLNAGIALHLFGTGQAQAAYCAGQGRLTGADGRVHCSADQDGAVWIGGRVDLIAQGAALANLVEGAAAN